MNHVWKLHGLPRAVVSDRGPQFVADFMCELYRILGIKVAASMAYHLQIDGQTERVNQELKQYIRLFMNQHQDDWDELLSMAEFQRNNLIHSSTQQTPFMLNRVLADAVALPLDEVVELTMHDPAVENALDFELFVVIDDRGRRRATTGEWIRRCESELDNGEDRMKATHGEGEFELVGSMTDT